jgi:hypothetical protein
MRSSKQGMDDQTAPLIADSVQNCARITRDWGSHHSSFGLC